MYETFYHLSATPFRLTPDARFCFKHPGYAQARAYLQYAFELGEGFIVLTGRAGAGKTTLVESFLSDLRAANVATARLAAANIEATDLLRSVAYAYQIDAENLDKATLLRRIAEHFSALMRGGQRVLLVIDEAQGLSCSALEELRLLADLAEGAVPLLQIFLVGQERLRGVMREPDMEQLRQRVIGTCRLEPMGLVETRDYIEHRLSRAGWKGDPRLTGEAVLAIFQYSGGTPRHVNKICTRLMLQGFMENKHVLDRDDVIDIGSELDEEQIAPAVTASEGDGQTAADPVLVAALHNDPAALSRLAVRAPRAVAAPPREVSVRREPPVVGPDAVAVLAQGTKDSAGRTHHDSRPDKARPDGRQFAAVDRAQAVQPLPGPVWRGYRVLSARVMHEVRKLPETPAALFSVVAAVTVLIAVVTSYVERAADGQHNLLVVNSQPLLPGPSVAPDDGRGQAVDPEGARAVPEQSDIPIAAPAASLPGQASDPVPVPENAGNAVAAGESRQPEPLSTAALEVSPMVPVTPAHGIPAVAGQPAGRVDTGAGDRDDAEALSLSSSGPGAVVSSAPASSASPAHAADATAEPAPLDPSAGDVGGDARNPVAMADAPAAGGVSEPRSGGGEAETVRAPVSMEISDLVTLARTAIRKDRLLIPEGNNAYGYYQQVLALDPDNTDARDGLKRIVERYIELAGRAIDRRDETRARRYIARGLRVQPREKRLLVLQDMMNRVSFDTRPENPSPVSSDVQPASRPAAAALEHPPRETAQPVNMFQRLKEFFSGKSSVSLGQQER
jgi:type II secretory pathway predicted ATPase ExeA